MNKKLLTAAPTHTGWVLGEFHKITKRRKDIWYKIKLIYSVLIEKISSLLSVDYYKSDNKNQFKDIQLQLHATTSSVTNPYTFSIQGNTSFSGICEVDLKNIKAMMTVGRGFGTYGFSNESYGSLSPNPLPNGVSVVQCYSRMGSFTLLPSSIKSCTINNITIDATSDNTLAVYNYLKPNNGKTIPVIFHFD